MNNNKGESSSINFQEFAKYSANNNKKEICSTTNDISNPTSSYIPMWLEHSNINMNNNSNNNNNNNKNNNDNNNNDHKYMNMNNNNNNNNNGNNNCNNNCNNNNYHNITPQYFNGNIMNHNNINGTSNRNRYSPYQTRSYSTGCINAAINYPSLQPLLTQQFSSGNCQNMSSGSYPNCNKILTESSNFNNINNNNNNNNNNINGNKNINSLNNSNNNMLSRSLQFNNMISSSSINTSHSYANNLITGSCNDLSSTISINNKNNNSNSNNNNNDPNQPITLQIKNLDYTLEEQQLRSFILNQLKPITPVISLIFEGSSCAKVTVPDLYYAKLVVSNMHRKKIGHKRVVVSYTRDSSSTEITTLRCQVAGLLKDVPYCTLPMYKFRELFQTRFKASISVLDLYKMQDICSITTDKSDDKHITLNSELIISMENNPLMEGLHESVPYCSLHFQKEQHKGWAEQEIEPLPNVFMTISEMKQIICPLLKSHLGDIPVSSLIYCIAGELGIHINPNENGVNLEHLVCCINGIQISDNNFGIKVLGWLEPENVVGRENNSDRFIKSNSPGDPLYQISKEVIELIKMSPKSTMKFNRFIPAYHNHFGKQCRVADYGYTKLIELFEALSSVVQIMGDGENRQITLTHRTQIRRFTTDLLRIIRSQGNKSILLSQLSDIYVQTQNRIFDVTDYGVCAIEDILDGLANSNIIVITPIQNGNDILISIPKRKQTIMEIEKTSVFAAEVVELLSNAPQYSILFQKFVRFYHYHFGYQCRLSDYGFLKLADLMESIQGVVEIELTTDEDKKIFLSSKVARRVFAEQLEDLIKVNTGAPNTCIKFEEVLLLHKKKYGYQIQSQTLGFANIFDAIRELPYVEIIEVEGQLWIMCHLNDKNFRSQTYKVCKIILNAEPNPILLTDLLNIYSLNHNEVLKENTLMAMKHVLDVKVDNGQNVVLVTRLMRYIVKVIKVVDQYKTLTLSEIKKYLSITLGDCFDIGYPNITTFIRAFPDIFNFEVNSLIDHSKITLVSTCALFPVNNGLFKIQNQQLMKSQQQQEKETSLLNSSLTMVNSAVQPNNSLNINYINEDPQQTDNGMHINNNDYFLKNYLENEKENQYLNGNFAKRNIIPNTRCPPILTSSLSLNNIHQHYNAQFYKQQLEMQYQQQQKQHQEQQHHHHHQHHNLISSFYGKDNSFNVSLNSSNASVDLNSSSMNINLNNNGNSLSLSNGSGTSAMSSSDGMNLSSDINSTDINNNDPINDFPKLWTGGNIDYFNNNYNYSQTDDIFELSKATKLNNSDNIEIINEDGNVPSDVVPFWVDPIWGNDNKTSDLPHDQKNSTIEDSTQFDMPELQKFKVILPMSLNNPYELSELENMKQNMFSLDNSNDAKLS